MTRSYFERLDTKTDDRGLQVRDYLFSSMVSHFAFIVKKLIAVFGTAVWRQAIFLSTDGIII